MSLFICFPFLLFGSLADFSLSLFLSCSISLVCLPPPPLNQPPHPSPHHNPNITWTPLVAVPTVFITGLPGGSQAPPSACCVSVALPVFLYLSLCLFVALPVSLNLSFVCLALCLSAGLYVSPCTHTLRSICVGKVFFFFFLIYAISICSGLQTFKIPQRTLVETMAAANDSKVSLVYFVSTACASPSGCS